MASHPFLRSAVVRSARAVTGALLIAALFGVVPADAAHTVDVPEVVLLESGETSTVLEYVFPLKRDVGATEPRLAADLDWTRPRVMTPGPDGDLEPQPHAEVATVAVPTRGVLGWEIVAHDWLVPPLDLVAIREAVTVDSPRVYRGVPLVSVTVRPELGGGVLGSLVVRLRHAPQPRFAAALSLKAVEPIAARDRNRVVSNPDLFADLSAGLRALDRRDKAGRQGETPFTLSDNWLRVEISQTGVHEVSGFDFTWAGVIGDALADVDPEKLRVFRAWSAELPDDPEIEPATWQFDYAGLTEIACELEEDDGVWDTADRILFYAVGPDDWADRHRDGAGPIDWQQHPYADRTVYWITWEDHQTASPHDGDPRRVEVRDATATGGAGTDRHLHRIHREEDVVESFGRLSDNWAWDTSVELTRSIAFDVPDAVTDSAAFFVAELRMKHKTGTRNSDWVEAGVWLNDGDQTGETAVHTWTVGSETSADSTRVRTSGWSDRLLDGANTLTVSRRDAGGNVSHWLMLDSADLMAWRRLVHDDGQVPFVHWGHQVQTPGETVDLELSYASGSAPRAWDVSDPDAPVDLTGTVAGAPTRTLTLGLSRDPDSDVHLVAFKTEDLLEPDTDAMSLRDPGFLRSVNPGVDYLIVHHPDFAADARRLEAHRAGDLITLCVSTDEVYDAFGGGVKDPLALRNFFKWLYTEGEGTLAAVCIFGDASRDYRHRSDQFEDFVPTVVRANFPSVVTIYNHPYATDDHIVSFDTAPNWSHDHPDLALGRLTVRDETQARRRVDTLIAYDQETPEGIWRNRVVMVADDFCQPSDDECTETMHMDQAEFLGNEYVPLSVDVEKLYLVDYAYDPGGTFKPLARQAARQYWNEGLTVFHYIGHGSENTLADEQVFLTDDIYGLTNGVRRGVFSAFSCDVGIYDSPTRQSMAETFVDQEHGGAIASIAASQVTYVTPNERLSEAFYEALYPDRRVVPGVTLGRALHEAKLAMSSGGLNHISNSQKYLLFGDPAIALPNPAAGPEFDAASVDTLRGGWREEVVCVLSDHGLSAGGGTGYDLVVREHREVKVATEDNTSYTYWLPGATVFHGTGTAADDTLRIPFKVPTQLRYGAQGKVRLVIDAPEGGHAVARELPVVQAPTGPVDDVLGPAIDLAFEDGRYRVKPGTTLHATVSDTSGISILGTSPLNSLLLVFDDSDYMSDVSDGFVFDPGSYTSGTLEITMPDNLALGEHTAALLASDVLGNVGSDTLSFQLVAGEQVAIEDVTLFPNPTAGPARLVFELSDPMTVSWSVFTLAGHRVFAMSRSYAAAGPQVMHWDGRDDAGDELANGVYLYVVSGSGYDEEGHRLNVTGKLVVMK